MLCRVPIGACLLMAALALASLFSGRAAAQVRMAAVTGTVTAMAGEVLLPGATVEVTPAGAGADASRASVTVSDERGRFRLEGLDGGTYRVTVRLGGFVSAERTITVAPGTDTRLDVDLRLEGISETVDVVPVTQVEFGASMGSAGRLDFVQLQAASAGEVAVDRALTLVPGVITGPAGVSVKGGRPTQSGVQLASADLTDPATGESGLRLPGDAVASLEVLPNPYAVEFGRFTSGLTLIQARKGGDAWRLSLASLHPVFRTARGRPWRIIGVEAFRPRLWLGGRLFGGRLAIAQSLHYVYSSTDIPSRPQAERTRVERLGSFTRFDATVASNHHLTMTLGAAPEARRYATLGTFDPPEVAASTRVRRYHAAVSEEWGIGSSTFLESLLHVKQQHARANGEGAGPMEIAPDGRAGSYFDDQSRHSWALQWRETLSGVRRAFGSSHYYKIGIDLVSSVFDGTNVSRPVIVRRADGTIAEHITFENESAQHARATDVAAFVQDRWQVTGRLLVEGGVRVDRDGVVRSTVVSPRLGVKVGVLPADRLSVTAGFGRFVERVPLTLGALDAFGTRVSTTHGDDGRQLGQPVRYRPRVGSAGLEAPRAVTWHVDSEWRLSPQFALWSSVLSRRGSREHVVSLDQTAVSGWLTVDSRGHSDYREFAVGARFQRGVRRFASVSYVRSTARADTNGYPLFFGTIREPVIRVNAFARADTDVPNRLVAQARGQFGRWRVASVLEWRDGLPYSALDERQAFVGVPNSWRLPARAGLDVAFERQWHLGRWKTWVGMELTNILNRFNPQDVQRNTDATDAGYLYNSEPRRALLTVKF